MKTTVNMPEDQKELVENVRRLLEENRISDAWELTYGEENKKLIGRCSHELFSVASRYLNEESVQNSPLAFQYSKDLVHQIATDYEPEETLLELLEYIENSDVTGFLIYVDLMEICLMKMPRKRGTSMIWVCNTIVRFLSEMKIDENEILTENDDVFQVYLKIVKLFQPFIQEIETGHFEIMEKHQKEYVETIEKFFMKILDRPLLFSDESYIKIWSEIFNYLLVFNEPLHYINFVEIASSFSIEAEYTKTSLLSFFNLIYVHNIGIEKISHIYSIEFILENLLSLVGDSLSKSFPVSLKAVSTLSAFLGRVALKSLNLNNLKWKVVAEFNDALTQTMIYCDAKVIRQKSVEIFKIFIYKFNSDGRYKLIMSLKKAQDPGLIGYGLTILKDLLAEALNGDENQDLRYFTSESLKCLLRNFIVLEPNCDLVRDSDRIISVLNLLRFILIRDKDNKANIVDYLKEVEMNFVAVLGKKIESARSELAFEKDGLIRCRENGESLDGSIMGLTANIPIDEQIKELDRSFTILDLIDSLRKRLDDL